ncbi:lipocalin family protein [Ulvibacterium marinum]|uniref:lipocalin family protein n=1 Tax=Ulvibacterium marinum TaxID=2419782 RepID=UPI002494A064|nr:lipocalin family protein [Ulvibacterium marinum]
MKKSILFLFLTTGLFFTSCNKDESEPKTDVDLIGTWTYIAYVDDDEGEIQADECDGQDSLTFMSDNTFNFTYHYNFDEEVGCYKAQDAIGSWEYISDGEIELDYSNGNNVEPNNQKTPFEISGDILTLTKDEGYGVFLEKYKKN